MSKVSRTEPWTREQIGGFGVGLSFMSMPPIAIAALVVIIGSATESRLTMNIGACVFIPAAVVFLLGLALMGHPPGSGPGKR
jgi:hypothetical protein